MFGDRSAMAIAALVVCALGGCFHPSIEDGGFACNPSDVPPCPEGLFCVGGFCHTSANGSTGDLALSTSSDLAGGNAPGDMRHAAGSDMATSSGSCAHDLCTTGSTLKSGCDPCVTQICGQDPYCCTTKWSSQCVQEVSSICQRACP